MHAQCTFTETGTEVHFNMLDQESGTLDKSNVKYDAKKGHPPDAVRLQGRLTLNYVDVYCNVHVEYSSMKGSGHLKVLGED